MIMFRDRGRHRICLVRHCGAELLHPAARSGQRHRELRHKPWADRFPASLHISPRNLCRPWGDPRRQRSHITLLSRSNYFPPRWKAHETILIKVYRKGQPAYALWNKFTTQQHDIVSHTTDFREDLQVSNIWPKHPSFSACMHHLSDLFFVPMQLC